MSWGGVCVPYLVVAGGDVYVFGFFFFSSRRRHTRCSRDWSSDVCSSDLDVPLAAHPAGALPVPLPLEVGDAFVLQRFAQPLHQRAVGDERTGLLGGPGEIGRASCRERV